MTVSLELAKAHLRILHDDQDALIGSHIVSADSAMARFLGDAYETYVDELSAAELIIIEWLFNPAEKVDIDPIHNLPRAVVALAGPYRTPTVA